MDSISMGFIPEDEHPVLEGLPLRAATLPALAKHFVQTFEDETQEATGPFRALPHVLLLTHQWFVPSVALAEQLVALHAGAASSEPCVLEECAHERAPCSQQRLRDQVCRAFRFWIMTFPVHFDMDEGLANTLRQFQATLTTTEAERLDLSQVPSYDWMRHASVRAGGSSAVRKVSLVFNNLQPLQLAEHLTFLEHKVLRRIGFNEIKQYVRSGSLNQSPKLERSVALCNGLTQWVQCMVLNRTTPSQRAHVMDKFIAVAQKLLELQNFNCLMAVVGSVSHSVLARLSRTMQCLPAESKRILTELTELLASTSNFSNYRKALQACKGFRIPILGIHLKDLVSLHVALPDMLDNEMINVRKMAQLSLIFEEFELLQHMQPPFDVNMDLVNTLRLSLDLAYTEEEIYEISLAREPRNATSPQSSPTQSVLFAEWAAGPCTPPDPQTIEKHVTAMVDAVFKTYDNDHDGYISHEEFEAVAGNFPFIASFCVLDADHDGMISQEEMKKYFVHANCHALKSGFKHDFHETTYFKPTFCVHCAGLLWGLIRQGYKCRDCGINAHKHCKELVVMECRPRPSPSGGDTISHVINARRKFRKKKKGSVADSSESSPPSPKYSTACDSEQSDSGGGSLPPSPKPSMLWSGQRRKISDSLLVPSHSRSFTARLRPQQSCPESTSTRCRPPLSHQAAILQVPAANEARTYSESGNNWYKQFSTATQQSFVPESQSNLIKQSFVSESCSSYQNSENDAARASKFSPVLSHPSFNCHHVSPGHQECVNQISSAQKTISHLFQQSYTNTEEAIVCKKKCKSQLSLFQENDQNTEVVHCKDRSAQTSNGQHIEQAQLREPESSNETREDASSIRHHSEKYLMQKTHLSGTNKCSLPTFTNEKCKDSCDREHCSKSGAIYKQQHIHRCSKLRKENLETSKKMLLDQHTYVLESNSEREDKIHENIVQRIDLCNEASTSQVLSHNCKEIEETRRQLQIAEEACRRLERENHFLLQQLEAAYQELDSLREHVGEVRQHTVAFILSQMETLHLQKDTHV